jgi:hypothetical protein
MLKSPNLKIQMSGWGRNSYGPNVFNCDLAK